MKPVHLTPRVVAELKKLGFSHIGQLSPMELAIALVASKIETENYKPIDGMHWRRIPNYKLQA